MSFIDDVRKKHEGLAQTLKDHPGIRRIVEDLYPDSAHFIYELLQNAEDTGAQNARFLLDTEKLTFEHDGRPFSEDDIKAITDIGEGTKASDEDKIGRFGVGFKAVFAYSETPYIWSPSFSFRISELVLPNEIAPREGLGQKTQFEFPFNNPKKPVETAKAEVQQGLEQLAETTLLFLSNIESVQWLDGKSNWEILRIPHSEFHIEILKQTNGKIVTSSHFLRFSQSVVGLEKQQVAIAFELEFLQGINSYSANLNFSKQFRIVPAEPGKVAVFFPAEKETSGLRFHLHAPFVPELSRSSIKDSAANGPLYDQLAKLSAKSLHKIRDLKLLNADFLAVLPNPQDSVTEPYKPIRKAIVSEMNNKPLTPTHAKSYAPAKHLLQAKASLKDLLSLDDIDYLVEYEEVAPQWAIGANQRNTNVDRFLNGLAIEKWDIDEFVEILVVKLSESSKYVPNRGWVSEPDEKAMAWLSNKTIEWHQQFYSLLFRELERAYGLYRLKNLRIVRISNGRYSIGKKCYFPEPGIKIDEVLPRVDEGAFASGKNKSQQTDAKKLLLELGVRDVNQADRIQAVLDRRYTYESATPDDETYLSDLTNFCTFLEKNPKEAGRFEDYYIFKTAGDDWQTPGSLYLDSPILGTNLTEYFEAIGDLADRFPLSTWYTECGLNLERFIGFARSVGALTELEIIETNCHGNSDWSYLRSVPGDRYTSPIDRDYTIKGLPSIIANPSLAVSRLIWSTLRSANKKSPFFFQATYRKNESNGSRYADSQLVHALRDSAWVPQEDGSFVCPCEADSSQLPQGFPFDPGEKWLAKLKFGEQLDQRNQDKERVEQLAVHLGFEDDKALQRAKRFASLPVEQQVAFLAEFERQQNMEFPEHKPRNPSLRSERVGEQAANAPGRIVEKRSRSVSIGIEGVKAEAVQYLKELYTSDDEMFCQICKAPMPFKLTNGETYFETVEFILGLDARHYQNYLALCPNHSAMFKYANNCEDLILSLFLSIKDSGEMEVILAQKALTIRFTETHIADLKKVTEVDSSN